MSGSGRVLAGWGLLLVALAAVQLVLEPRAVEVALLGGGALAMVALGALATASERRRPRPDGEDETQLVPWSSAAAAATGAGLALFVLGWEVGPWLVGVGAGVIALGAGGLVRERRAERRA